MSLTIHQVRIIVELMKFLLKQLVFEFQVLLSSSTILATLYHKLYNTDFCKCYVTSCLSTKNKLEELAKVLFLAQL